MNYNNIFQKHETWSTSIDNEAYGGRNAVQEKSNNKQDMEIYVLAAYSKKKDKIEVLIEPYIGLFKSLDSARTDIARKIPKDVDIDDIIIKSAILAG